MPPRFIRVLPELPMTPTNEVRKNVLRAEGSAAGTQVRAALGINIRCALITSGNGWI